MPSPHAATEGDDSRRKMLDESRRAREFYRYYKPIRELTTAGPTVFDIGNDAEVLAHQPSSSPDRALTAFCQLGALRLRAKRAMLFFFDSDYAYVLAESTRTLSLQDDTSHAPTDDLWLGHTIIPRGYSVCEHTIMLPANLGSNKDDPTSSMVHIINDLIEDTRFCDRPFVTGGPKARFYAGVPITTPRGVNIGAYCILDDEYRSGLDAGEIQFMRDIAVTVMAHLDLARATAEHKIGTQMVAGLGAFIDGASGFRDWAEKNTASGKLNLEGDPVVAHPQRGEQATDETFDVKQAAVAAIEQQATEDGLGTGMSSMERTITPSSDPSASAPSTKPLQSLAYKRSTENADDPGRTSTRSTFQRAANLVREAMDLEGVVFLDASVGAFGGLIEPSEESAGISTTTDYSSDMNHDAVGGAATTGTEGEEHIRRNTTRRAMSQKHCPILASSVAILGGESEDEANRVATEAHGPLTERFLRSLLRRYPRGKIWSFDENGDGSSDEDDTTGYKDNKKACRCSVCKVARTEKQSHAPSCSRRRRKQNHLDDGKEILRLFPGIRSMGVMGMWDHKRQRWYAACLFWSSSPLRLFSHEAEVTYISAFCDVILAELHRIEAQSSDRAKSDFISTISHELRSPLHGILGSVECLEEQQESMDSFSANLVSQIEICGRTLLDIIDHLLDFTKINHHSKSRPKSGKDSGGHAHGMSGLMQLTTDVALDRITEEIVETAVYSFCSSRDSDTILKRNVAVILDIDQTPDLDWRFQVAVGAWKRICINLVSNALKYTTEGHIRISLRMKPVQDKKKQSNVIFSVTDTGRGMSLDFLNNHLFRAFSQEDSLVEGTGLGMNIVARIVKSFGGRLEVLSDKGVGSCFSITMPLEHSRVTSRKQVGRTISGLARAVSDVSVGVIDSPFKPGGEQKSNETARTLLMSSVHKTLQESGLAVLKSTWAGDESCQVYLITEAELKLEMQRRDEAQYFSQPMSPSALSNKPFIVLCESAISARKLRAPGLHRVATGHIELIAQPVGPERLIKAIISCMKNRPSLPLLVDQPFTAPLQGAPPSLDHAHQEELSPEQKLPFRYQTDRIENSPPVGGFEHSRPPETGEKLQSLPIPLVEGALVTEYKFPRPAPRPLNGTSPSLSAEARSRTKLAPNSNGPQTRGLSLLLVDDNQINLQLLNTYAGKFGHHRRLATDGLQAVELYKTACAVNGSHKERTEIVGNEVITKHAKPQVIVMDINMPVLDGFEATRRIRRFERENGIAPATVIALTGLGSASAQQEAFSSGVDLFLTKPVRLKELTKILDDISGTLEK